ncbi:MAG: hypothetical protein HYY42_04105 [Chloroflexi bacterium]|nr:hypothetical protein [Chloroflexota bacterium]
MSPSRAIWIALATIAGALAAIAVARWVWAVTVAGPVLYGEGAVAHAALLSRDGLEYTAGAALVDTALRPIFTAANYPPLYFRLAGLGDPFTVGRIASIVATLFVAGTIAWRARAAGVLVAFAIGAAWLATVPVVVWGAALKPDLVALALTVGGVLALAASPRRPVLAGILLAVAIWTKPTAARPAAALAVWCLRQDGATLARYVAGGIAGIVASSVALMGPSWPVVGGSAFVLHVIGWNALPWSAEQATLLALVAVATLGVLIAAPLLLRALRGPVAAYLAGAVAIVALGGREGATINYLLDLSAAAALAVAAHAPRPSATSLFPVALAGQLTIGLLSLDPLGLLPGRPGTGAWADPSRIEVVRSLPDGPALVEDAGLLLAAGREPVVDDLFLWSRLYAARGAFDEGPRLVDAVRDRRFTSVVSEVDLERIDRAPAYERARWHPDLVRAVLDGYVLDRRAGALWVYRPK